MIVFFSSFICCVFQVFLGRTQRSRVHMNRCVSEAYLSSVYVQEQFYGDATSLFQLSSENELDLLSLLPKGWQLEGPPSTQPCVLMPSTQATFLARRYRFIIELDLSPSTGIVVRPQLCFFWFICCLNVRIPWFFFLSFNLKPGQIFTQVVDWIQINGQAEWIYSTVPVYILKLGFN